MKKQPTTLRPILFSPPMVQAILQGRKTQTRRIIKPQPENPKPHFFGVEGRLDDGPFTHVCPYGTPGHHLWVRETWAIVPAPPPQDFGYIYKADFDDDPFNWRPSIHMPRAASRIHLEITHIRAQRLHDITQADAYDEGFEWVGHGDISPLYQFQKIWEKINGPHSWEQNPWVWAITFKKID